MALIGLLFGCFVQEGNKPHCNASSWLTSLLGFRRMTRRCALGRLIGKADTPALAAFKHGTKLLAECERRGWRASWRSRLTEPITAVAPITG
jgi:hypothetical protein